MALHPYVREYVMLSRAVERRGEQRRIRLGIEVFGYINPSSMPERIVERMFTLFTSCNFDEQHQILQRCYWHPRCVWELIVEDEYQYRLNRAMGYGGLYD